MEPKVRIMGGFPVSQPSSVRRLDKVKRTLLEEGTEETLKVLDQEISQAWAIDGFWANVTLEPVYEGM